MHCVHPEIAEQHEAACAVLDSAARYFLGLSGEEFMEKWQSGYYADPDSIPGVMEVASLIP